jgi:hypothetical protein
MRCRTAGSGDEADPGLPGDRTAVVLLYLAMLGLIIDDLTVPDLLAPHRLDVLIDAMVTRLLPES